MSPAVLEAEAEAEAPVVAAEPVVKTYANVTFGPKRRVLDGADVPVGLREAAEAVVLAEDDKETTDHAWRRAELDELDAGIVCHRYHAYEAAEERAKFAATNFAAAVCRYYSWATIVVMGKAVWYSDPIDGCREVRCRSVDGIKQCSLCSGTGRRIDRSSGVRVVEDCGNCRGAGVRRFGVQTAILDGIAASKAQVAAEAREAEVQRLAVEF